MRTGDIRIFDDKKKLREMLSLYELGETLIFLARKYGVDHTSILYQVKKFKKDKGIKKELDKEKLRQFFDEEKPKRAKGKSIPNRIPDEKKCHMNYEDYLVEERRRQKKMNDCQHKIWVKKCSCCGKILENT